MRLGPRKRAFWSRPGAALRALWLLIAALLSSFTTQAAAQDFIAPVRDRGFMERVLQRAEPSRPPPAGLTGITVPHHALAADLIARGFWAASQGSYDRIVLLAPDHFGRVKGPFATTDVLHETLYGTVPADRELTAALLSHPLFENHAAPFEEHGSMVLMPFIARFFPGTPVTVVFIATPSTAQDWDEAFELLAAHLTPRSLVIQSTDYSHFLPVSDAVARDQETLARIANGTPEAVTTLIQPDHLDAPGAQVLQMRLQRDVFGSSSAVVAHRNSVAYGTPAGNTTSYMVTLYHPQPEQLSRFDYPDQDRFALGGDILLGRYMTPLLQDGAATAAMMQSIIDATAGAPLIANLEGVLFPEPLINAPASAHVMQQGLAGPVLQNLNMSALSLGNNHTLDFGADGMEVTRAALDALGITALPHGTVVDFGPARLLALNMVPGREPHVLADDGFDWLCDTPAAPPLIVFVHWGEEHTNAPAPAQREIAEEMAACGVSAVIGAHSHLSSSEVEVALGRMPWVFSLGNLLFDQSGTRADGALAEVRVFEQGTVAVRLLPLGNLFDTGLAAMSGQ